MVKVCDAIMGSGKSSAAITYINEHPDDKFVYITPFLDEAARISRACPDAHFVEPRDDLPIYNFKKSVHTAAMIREGRSIATTHQAFRGYTREILDMIRDQKYTLLCDENVDVLEEIKIHPDDMRIAVRSGLISEDNGVYTLADKSYSGYLFSDVIKVLSRQELLSVSDGDSGSMFFWQISKDLFTAFRDVIIMTYLFKGQSLHHFLEIYGIPYVYIGVERSDCGEYRFCDGSGDMPEYVSSLGNKLRILDNVKMNSVGNGRNALSMHWFKSDNGDVARLKRNTYNFFNNMHKDVGRERRLWSTYNSERAAISGLGYTKSFLQFCAKATNVYRDRDCLAYLVNLFMSVGKKRLFVDRGVDVDEDLYALSVMIQWIWRSAIRDGSPVELYLPSERMRSLLQNWVNNVSRGGC